MSVYCPACHSQDLEIMFNMGRQPMSLVALQGCPRESECLERFSIKLAICNRCGHVHNIDFNPNYISYTEGCRMYNDGSGWAKHMDNVYWAAESCECDTIIEIGAGDCQFLADLDTNAVKIAVDPAHSSAVAAEELGIHHIREYFAANEHIPEGAGVVLIIMRHLLEHMEHPRDFIEDIANRARSRAKQVRLLIEVPCCENAVANGRIEDWTYEHPQHFTATSLGRMLNQAGARDTYVKPSYANEVLIATAELWPRDSAYVDYVVHNYKRITERVGELRAWMEENLDRIAFWGGAGKSAMFIRKFRLPDYALVVDSHDTKWGMYVPGTRIVILPPTRILEATNEPPTIIATTSWRAEDIAKEIVRDGIPCKQLLKFKNGNLVEVPLGN